MAGLIDKALSYEEYIWKVVLPKSELAIAIRKKLAEMGDEELRKAAQRTRPKPERQELWRASTTGPS